MKCKHVIFISVQDGWFSKLFEYPDVIPPENNKNFRVYGRRTIYFDDISKNSLNLDQLLCRHFKYFHDENVNVSIMIASIYDQCLQKFSCIL